MDLKASWIKFGTGVFKKRDKTLSMGRIQFKECLGKQDLLTKMIAGRNKAVKDFGVKSTPTLFINDEKFSGDLTPEGLTKAIEAAL